MSGNIRFIKNMFLNVEIDGKMDKIPFSFGDIYPIDHLKKNSDGRYDIIFKDGSTAIGVKKEGLFENMKATVIENNDIPQ